MYVNLVVWFPINSEIKLRQTCNMSASRKNIVFCVILTITIIYGICEAAPPAELPSPSTSPYNQQEHNARSFRNALNQQVL